MQKIIIPVVGIIASFSHVFVKDFIPIEFYYLQNCHSLGWIPLDDLVEGLECLYSRNRCLKQHTFPISASHVSRIAGMFLE
jgi:hypothetical protein